MDNFQKELVQAYSDLQKVKDAIFLLTNYITDGTEPNILKTFFDKNLEADLCVFYYEIRHLIEQSDKDGIN